MIEKMAKDREDEYFARQEFERRKKLAIEHEATMKKKDLEALKKLHWMCCPKDGMELVEIEFMGVQVDKCTHCGGIFLDAGELDQLFDTAKNQGRVFAKILGAFR